MSSQEVPSWVKNNAGWWAESDSTTVRLFQAYSDIKSGIIVVEQLIVIVYLGIQIGLK